jgi:aspartyl-tRNA(Asn)/glutamyl-tRNA(Gln) amidotransferase subunit B
MEYLATIGLEVHAQISTRSKMFCGCSASYAGAQPNSHVCPTCLGLPGSLPVINARAVELAAMTGLALHCRIEHDNLMARKNYFYPDLPSGYQRSQYEEPLCVAGWLEIVGDDGEPKRVGITRVHIEEDTGKLLHGDSGHSLVDFNRAGVPLMEIVSEPDISSPEEAKRYFQKLRQLLVWIGVNSGDMEAGALRCDANVSVRPIGQREYGAKVEIKNINSFRFVERAVVFEISRQIAELKAGRTIVQQTRGWDEATATTVAQRTKEFAHDYRYFPDPDLPPLMLEADWVAQRQAELPELPDTRRARFMASYELSYENADLLTMERATADYFEQAVAAAGAAPAREVANWTTGELFRLLKESGESLEASAARFRPEYIGALIGLLGAGTITRTVAKQVFEESFRSGESPAAIVEARGLKVIADSGALETLAREVIAAEANAKTVADYRGGKAAAIKALVGQIMKATKGQANPQAALAALEAELARE